MNRLYGLHWTDKLTKNDGSGCWFQYRAILKKPVYLRVMFAYCLLQYPTTGWTMSCNHTAAKSTAVQQIEYLRRWYARATDLLGTATKESTAEGRAIYHRIFSPNVTFTISGPDAKPLSATGPDSWVHVVLDALAPLGPTQHLIGTQLVEIQSLQLNDDCEITEGRAHMQSYVQAWHEMPDDKVWLFLGTYIDEVEFKPGVGWQIQQMELTRVTGETRPMDESVASR